MYVVKYSGPFGFIKPWTAVRDRETFSQQFLTPSIVLGIELKLFSELLGNSSIQKIKRHRLSYKSISLQQEQIHPKSFIVKRQIASRPKAILNRGVMINPVLYLAFENLQDAEKASMEHICLCRNEDLLFPDEEIRTMSEDDFNMLEGFELIFDKSEESFMVGFNRFENAKPMYGRMEIQGNPVKSESEE